MHNNPSLGLLAFHFQMAKIRSSLHGKRFLHISPWRVVQVHYAKGKDSVISLFSVSATLQEKMHVWELFQRLTGNVDIKSSNV